MLYKTVFIPDSGRPPKPPKPSKPKQAPRRGGPEPHRPPPRPPFDQTGDELCEQLQVVLNEELRNGFQLVQTQLIHDGLIVILREE